MRSFIISLKLFSRVILALVLHEIRTRYSLYKLSYLWAIIEPCMHILAIYLLFKVLGKTDIGGMDAISMIVTGIIPWLLFNRTIVTAMSAVKNNRALLSYPQIVSIDLIISRALLELFTSLIVLFLLVAILVNCKDSIEINNIFLVVFSVVSISLMALGLSLLFYSFMYLLPSLDQFISSILRPIYFTSGVFFTANALPWFAMKYLWYNPLLHTTEMLRTGLFVSYNSMHFSCSYIFFWSTCCLFIGLCGERITKKLAYTI